VLPTGLTVSGAKRRRPAALDRGAAGRGNAWFRWLP